MSKQQYQELDSATPADMASVPRKPGHWLPLLLQRPLHLLTGSLVILALVGSVVLISFDFLPQFLPAFTHAPVSAVPLLLIGLAYLSLQPLVRPTLIELTKRVLLGSAFILWGIDQFLPAGWAATTVGDLVIILYVVDLGLIIRSHLQSEDWETP